MAAETLTEYLQAKSAETEASVDNRVLFALSLFADMAHIPSPSGFEKPLGEHIMRLADAQGFKNEMDETGNVVVWVPATPGYEERPGLILQAHQDGVPKADDGKPDPSRHGVRPLIDATGTWLTADGTTLWADNRAGLVSALALASDKTSVHPKMMLLFTVGEETDMRGVSNFRFPINESEYPVMWNLDSEEEGEMAVGSACAGYSEVTFPVARELIPDAVELSVQIRGTDGLRHSGIDIHKGRKNANKLAAAMLRNSLDDGIPLRIVSVTGDNYQSREGRETKTRNVICREVRVTVAIPKSELERSKKVLETYGEAVEILNRNGDPDLAVTIGGEATADVSPVLALSEQSTRDFVDIMTQLPHGVLATEKDAENKVLVSTNLAVARISEQELTASFSLMTRAAAERDMESVRNKIEAVLTGFSGSRTDRSPVIKGWTANNNYQMTEFLSDLYEELFGVPLTPLVYHAGLETGDFAEKYPHIDIKSFGPEITGAHSTKEQLNLPSFYRFVRFLFAASEAYARRTPVND